MLQLREEIKISNKQNWYTGTFMSLFHQRSS